MLSFNLKPILAAILAFLLFQHLAGCAALQTEKQFDAMKGIVVSTVERMQDGALSQYQVSGQGINPKIAVEAGIIYRAAVGYEGLAGQFSANASGQLGRQVDQAALLAIYNDTSLSVAERQKLIFDRIGASK